jgi:hypothetical protein
LGSKTAGQRAFMVYDGAAATCGHSFGLDRAAGARPAALRRSPSD